MATPFPYQVNIAQRIEELCGTLDIPSSAVLNYSFNMGYERLVYQESPETGCSLFEGAYHPDGYCTSANSVCTHCGALT